MGSPFKNVHLIKACSHKQPQNGSGASARPCPPTQRSARQTGIRHERNSQYQEHTTQFCTQQCLLGLQEGGKLDAHCPNVKMHHKSGDGCQHLVNTEILVQLLKKQLDRDLDHNCTPFGDCGGYGAPFKVTCAAYGYTVFRVKKIWLEVNSYMQIMDGARF